MRSGTYILAQPEQFSVPHILFLFRFRFGLFDTEWIEFHSNLLFAREFVFSDEQKLVSIKLVFTSDPVEWNSAFV